MLDNRVKIEKTALREGTTKHIEIEVLDQDNEQPFDLTGYTVQTYLTVEALQQHGMVCGGHVLRDGMYLQTDAAENVISYTIPASATVGQRRAFAETRIFKEHGANTGTFDVFEVIRVQIDVLPAAKPDVVPLPHEEKGNIEEVK